MPLFKTALIAAFICVPVVAATQDIAEYKDVKHRAVCMKPDNALNYLQGHGWRAIFAGTADRANKVTTAFWVNHDASKYAVGELRNGEYCFFLTSDVHKQFGIDTDAIGEIFGEQLGWHKS